MTADPPRYQTSSAGPIEAWPQVGDEALVARPHSGMGSSDGKTATIKRGRVVKIGKRDVTLDLGVRFRADSVRDGEAVIRDRSTWGANHTYVMHPEHKRAAEFRKHNDLARHTAEVRRLAGKIDHQARADRFGGQVATADVAELFEAVRALGARRVAYGLEPAPADGPGEQHDQGQHDDQPEDGVDDEAENRGDGDDEQREEHVK